MTSFLDEHMEALELTDLPGHCKFCGEKVESEDFPMQDPDGLRDPIYFCYRVFDSRHLDYAQCGMTQICYVDPPSHTVDYAGPARCAEAGKSRWLNANG